MGASDPPPKTLVQAPGSMYHFTSLRSSLKMQHLTLIPGKARVGPFCTITGLYPSKLARSQRTKKPQRPWQAQGVRGDRTLHGGNGRKENGDISRQLVTLEQKPRARYCCGIRAHLRVSITAARGRRERCHVVKHTAAFRGAGAVATVCPSVAK